MKRILPLIAVVIGLCARADETSLVGAAFCARNSTGACHVEWRWLGTPGLYQVVQRFESGANQWRIVEEVKGTTFGTSAATVDPGHLYRVRACHDPIIDSTCSESTVFWAPFQAATVEEIPELVVSDTGRIYSISKNNALPVQLSQYNFTQLVVDLEDVDPSALPPMTAPVRRWGAKNFDSWDSLINMIYDGYAQARQPRPSRVVDASQPAESIADVPETEWAQFRAKRLRGEWIEEKMIVFSPAVTRYTVTIFADIACEHCRQIMRDIDELSRLGVRVRFLAFPLRGPNSDVGRRMADVWCAADPKGALRRAIFNEPLAHAKCDKAVVPLQYALARQLGFIGSPTIVTETGEVIGGYLTPMEMVSRLDALPKLSIDR